MTADYLSLRDRWTGGRSERPAQVAFGTYGPRDAPTKIMSLTYDEGEIQPEQRVAHLIIYPLVFAAVAAIIVTVIITKMSPMHMGS